MSDPQPNSTPELNPSSAAALPVQAEAPQTPTTLVARVQAFRARYEKAEMAVLFFGGFLYDVLTLSRIDDRFGMIQQGVYLAVLAALLVAEQRYSVLPEPPGLLGKVLRFREDALHFFLGSLLSSFTLFFFKSASGATAFLFLLVLFGLLVANELPRFRSMGPVVRVGLFSLCVTAYFGYVLPVMAGRLGWWLFTIAVALGSGSIYGMMRLIRRWIPDAEALKWRVAVPGFGVQGLLLVLYLVKVLPPVPLAVQFSGIYHSVERVKGENGKVEYRLAHERSWWRFWQRGDQRFLARPGDKPYYFFSVFAPSGFERYKLRVRWEYDHPEKGWTDHGSFLADIKRSGVERGYRSYAFTSNPKPGDWRVTLETEDGGEIGRLGFSVVADESTEPRQFLYDQG
ncbi:MAG TPA: DUF2914 domain-containing protein [Myxococcaceae bacterium]|nr:DUF2914 domain-containing protein [Myxococcaceae bacterium]